MPWPDTPEYIQPGIWEDEYRQAGGIVVPEYAEEMQRQQTIDSYGYDAPVYEPEPEPYTGGFVGLDEYTGIVGDKLNPYEAYQEYLNVALPSQLRDMGYNDEEIQYATTNFPKLSPPPPEDLGFFGNASRSFTSGLSGGRRATEAAGYDAAGDNTDDLARLAVEQAADRPNAPRVAFQEAARTDGSSTYESAKAFLSAAWNNPQGLLDESIYQTAQSAPVIAAGLAALLVPSPGAAPAAAGATSFMLDTGATLLGDIVDMAQKNGVDVNDPVAIKAMLDQPGVYEELADVAQRHGFGVGVTDAALSSITFGIGGAAARTLRAGQRGRAAAIGLGGLGVGAAGGGFGEYAGSTLAGKPYSPDDIVAEALLGLSNDVAFEGAGAIRGLRNAPAQVPGGLEEGEEYLLATNLTEPEPQGPIPTLTGGIVPTGLPTIVADTQGNAMLDTLENHTGRASAEQYAAQVAAAQERAARLTAEQGALPLDNPNEVVPPGTQGSMFGDPDAPFTDLTPGARPGEPPPPTPPPAAPVAPSPGPTTQGTLPLVDPNQRVRRGTQGDLFGELVNLAPDARRIEPPPPAAVAPPTYDIKDANSVNEWLAYNGVVLQSKAQMDAVASVVAARAGDRQLAIADAVEHLAETDEVGAEPLANALLQISRTLPVDRITRARAEQLLQDALPGTPPAQIPKVAAAELAADIVRDLEKKPATPAPDSLAFVSAPQGAPSATTQPAAAPASAKPVAAPTTPDAAVAVQSKRGLASGERLPDTSLGGLAGQLGGGPAVAPKASARKPGGSLRDRVDQEGTGGGGRSGPVAGGEAVAPRQGAATAGGKPNSLAGAARVPGLTGSDARQRAVEQAQAAMRERAEKGQSGTTPEVQRFRASRMFDDLMMLDANEYEAKYLGRSYDQDMELYAAGTGRGGLANKVKGSKYGNQKADIANKEAIAQQRADKKAKAAARKAREEEPVTEDDYEETYPGRDLGLDSDDIFSAQARPSDPSATTEPPIEPRVLQSFTRMPFSSVMNYLSAVLPSPLQRTVAARLEELGISVPITVGPLPGTEQGRYTHRSVPGQQGTATITIDPKKGQLKTVLHEGAHAATVEALRNPKTPQQAAAGKKIRELFAYVQKVGSNDPHIYGMKDEFEFVAEAFSNPEFQKILHDMKLPGAPKVSVWTAFKQAVLQLLGHRSVLSDVLMHGEDLLSPDQPYEGSGAYAAAPNKAPPSSSNRGAPSGAIVGIKNNVRTHMAYAKDKTNPQTTYTLYSVAPGGDPRGDPATKVAGLSRAQAEQYIKAQGAEPLAPASDAMARKGDPKNGATKQVGYGTNGALHALGFQQKDGTWTYYESDRDVRTDPTSRVHKGLSLSAVQRAITARGLAPVPPVPGAVSANGAKPTAIGYKPAGEFQYTITDVMAPIKAIGLGQEAQGHAPSENVGITATLRNSNAVRVLAEAKEKYVEPVAKLGKQISMQYGKSQAQIEKTLVDLHLVERMQNKINQTLRGTDDAATQAKRNAGYQKKMAAAKARLDADRNSLPQYVNAVERDFAPLWKKMTDNTTDLAARYGKISIAVAQNMKNAYDFYVPVQKGDKTTAFKAATGANDETDRSFQRVIQQLERTVHEGEDNLVTKSVADAMRKYGVVNTETNEPMGTVGQGVAVKYDEETNSLSEKPDSHMFDPNTVFFYENGERVPITIANDPTLLKALNPYKGETRNAVFKGLMLVSSWLNRVVAVGKTSLSPAFMFGNIQRDIQAANINMPRGVSYARFNANLADLRNIAAVTKNVALEVAGKKPTGDYAEAREAGAFIDHRDYVGMQALANDVDAYFRPTRSLKGLNALRKSYGSTTFDVLSMAAQISESIPRLAMYKAARDSWMHGKPDTAQNRKEASLFAAHAAKTASVNFEQRGSANLSSWWMFGNAKVQGLNALAKTAVRAPIRTTAALAGITALGFLIGNAQQEGEKDKDGKPKSVKLSDQMKDAKVFLNEGGWALSLNQEVSPFYVFGHALSEYVKGNTDGAHTVSRITTSLFNNLFAGNVPQTEIAGYKANPWSFFIQSLLPTGIIPFDQIRTNKNTYGTEIVAGLDKKLELGIPKSQMGNPDENQLAINLRKNGYLSEGANKFVKALPTLAAQGIYDATGGKLDPAPQQIRFINNYFNKYAETYAFVRDMAGGRESAYPGDIVNPIMRKLTANATPFYDQQQFDELLSKAKRAEYLVSDKNPNRVPFESLSPEDKVLAQQAKTLKKVDSDGDALFKGEKLMTPQRRALLNERKREMMLSGIRRYNEARDRAGISR